MRCGAPVMYGCTLIAITRAPHRIRYLEKLYEYILQRPGVALWTGEQILDWYKKAR